jgi:outer membrane protein
LGVRYIIWLIAGCGICMATPTTIKPLPLAEAVALANASNPAVRMSSIQRVVDKYALQLAYHAYAPQYQFVSTLNQANTTDLTVGVRPSVSWQTQSGLALGASYQGVRQDGTFSDHADITVKLPLMRGAGYTINQIPLENAVDQEAINALSYRDAVASVINTVQAQYFKVIADQEQRAALRLSLQRSQETLAEYKIKVEAGDMAASSIPQQESQILSDQMQLEHNANVYQADYKALMLLLGLNPKSTFRVSMPTEEYAAPLPSVEAGIKAAKQGNYRYQQQLISLRALGRSAQKADDDTRPIVDLVGTVNTEGQKGVGLSLTIPINDMSAQYAALSANSAFAKGTIALEQAERDLVAHVIDSLETLNSQKKQIDLATKQVQFAKQNYENTRLSHRYGKASAYEVTSQMQALLQSELALINIRIQYYTEYAEWNKFIGHTLTQWQIRLVK